MKKIILTLMLVVLATLAFANRATDAYRTRALNRHLLQSGLTSSGTYLSEAQAWDKWIDSNGKIAALYVDSLYFEGGTVLADTVYIEDGIAVLDSLNSGIIASGANQWDNGSNKIDGEQIADDTIDDDSIDFTDVTGADLTLTDCTNITASATVIAEHILSTDDAVITDDLQVAQIICTDNVGTASDSVTVVEYGNGHWHKTVITVNTHYAAIAGGAALSLGQLMYTFPAGAVVVKAAYMSIALDEDDGNITADTPDIGLGTTTGSGANATLDAVGAAAENILTGQTANDCNGTAEVKTVADQILVIESGADHTVYLNIADTWAASGEDNLAATGTVVLEWVFVQ